MKRDLAWLAGLLLLVALAAGMWSRPRTPAGTVFGRFDMNKPLAVDGVMLGMTFPDLKRLVKSPKPTHLDDDWLELTPGTFVRVARVAKGSITAIRGTVLTQGSARLLPGTPWLEVREMLGVPLGGLFYSRDDRWEYEGGNQRLELIAKDGSLLQEITLSRPEPKQRDASSAPYAR
ncbi:MAG: hypothetical protein FJX76_08615 [Armatimonadetes bacterium]|nr:hypothetical protein [Armatimonadota bacterium]